MIINAKLAPEVLQDLLQEHDVGFCFLDNASLQKQIGANQKIVLTTKSHCDCGSILGINAGGIKEELRIQKEKYKLEQKKWSAKKIERYLANKWQKYHRASMIEENNWLSLLQKLVTKQGKTGVLIHHSQECLREETIEIKQTNQLSISLLPAGALRTFTTNHMYWMIA